MTSSSPISELQIPQRLLDAVVAARETCPWHRRGECKKGPKCKYHHPTAENLTYLPHISVYRTKYGENRIEIRTPARDMMKAYFSAMNMTCPVDTCHRVKRTPLLEFQFLKACMQQPDGSTGNVWVDDRKRSNSVRHFQKKEEITASCGDVKLPKYIIHRTTAVEGLQIMQDGFIKPTVGIAGRGVYGVEVKQTDKGKCDNSELSNIWNKNGEGHYSKGCAFLLRVLDGCRLTHGQKGSGMCAGVVYWNESKKMVVCNSQHTQIQLYTNQLFFTKIRL